ncbi:serine/threonine-protein kinase [Catenulispora pinisilvae]|uniref:serine/threonine-protein kinase n=1 Tax=Catenulispora pinisilvae TaxID=2705253 RepID=UPI001E39EBD5|nr:serine/threonine-protein kinase [Catenulispora pinisilvae]
MSDDVDTEQLAPPERVIAERYVLRTELGRGGMGVVWRAEDRVIARPVAVKEMRLADGVTTSERAEFEQRILREARTAGRLNDPSVVTVYDVVHDNGSVFIVMELVEAPTLAQLVRRSGPLSPRAVADIGRQVLSALEAAHGAGIVHRDVKPSNIMVGQNGRAKLTDFGIAQAVDDPTLTKTGAVIGSPAYLAPERLSGQEASAASDLWSLGAVLYFAIEGKPAFERDTTAATFGAVLNEVPYLTNVQGPLAAAISGMLAISPAGRLTAPQVRTLLDAAAADSTKAMPQGTMVMPADGTPTATMSIGGPPPENGAAAGIAVTPAAKRSWARIAGTFAAAVLVTAAVAGFAGYGTGSSSGKKQAQKAEAQPSDAVKVYTLGGPGADFPSLQITSTNTCMSGPPFMPGTPTYQNGDCTKSHDLELYFQTDLISSTFDYVSGSTDSPKVPYPGVAELTSLARQLCWSDRAMTQSWTAPKNSEYTYYALIPSQNLWDGKNLPSDWTPDDQVSCLMTNATGQQLPADMSQ